MRDLLVRYLLGELNAQEQERLDTQLRDSPEMRRELEYLRACLPGGCDDADVEHSHADECATGLAERTLGRICGDAPHEELAHSPAEVASAYDPPAGTPSWSLADLTVAGGVFLAISMLFLPALRQSRDAARRTGCAKNLREVGTMLVAYAETKGGFFPTPTRDENAGIFAVYLFEEGYAGSDELARLLLCRSSPLAEEVAAKHVIIRVPTMCELEAATCKQRAMWKRIMGGSYAYRIGYFEGDRYCAIRNEGSCHKAMLADAPCNKQDNLQSDHHCGGYNAFYQDGHVKFQVPSTLPASQHDAIYVNDDGEEAAGLDRDDTVLGRSEVTPGSVGPEFAP